MRTIPEDVAASVAAWLADRRRRELRCVGSESVLQSRAGRSTGRAITVVVDYGEEANSLQRVGGYLRGRRRIGPLQHGPNVHVGNVQNNV